MTTIVSLVGADWNESADDVSELAKSIEGALVRGHHVDHAIVTVNDDTPVDVVGVDQLPKGGSDHFPLLIHLVVDGHDITVLVWNVYVGQRPRRVKARLRKLIRQHKPDAILLQEAYRCGPVLAALAEKAGYHLIQGPNVGEGADCALLMRADHDLRRHGRQRMSKKWTGPKHNLPKQPREFPYGRSVIAPGLVLRAMSAHQATGGPKGRNSESVTESRERITRWLTNPQHVTRKHRQKETHR